MKQKVKMKMERVIKTRALKLRIFLTTPSCSSSLPLPSSRLSISTPDLVELQSIKIEAASTGSNVRVGHHLYYKSL